MFVPSMPIKQMVPFSRYFLQNDPECSLQKINHHTVSSLLHIPDSLADRIASVWRNWLSLDTYVFAYLTSRASGSGFFEN